MSEHNESYIYISADQLARMLNMSRGTIYAMRRKGILPEGVKLGNSRRWNLAEIKSFLKGDIQQ